MIETLKDVEAFRKRRKDAWSHNAHYWLTQPLRHWSARLELCQWERERLDKESIWDEERSISQSRL